MNRRLVVALAAALVISGLFTLMLSHKMAKKPAPSAPKVEYIVAAAPIAAGEVIQPAALKVSSWPADSPVQGGFTTATGLAGRTAAYPIATGEPVLSTDLATAGSGLGIAAHIPTGMRAIALRTDDVVAVGGFIYPGAHVDVLATYHPVNNAKPVTATVLQDVLVLATGQKTTPDPKGKPTSVNIVTLLLTPEQAEQAVLAGSQGTIHFVMRNGVDEKKVQPPPIGLAQLANAASAGQKSSRALRPRPHPVKPNPYTVETILGNRTETASF